MAYRAARVPVARKQRKDPWRNLRGAEIIKIPFATADNWKRIAPNFAELRRTDNRMIQTFSAYESLPPVIISVPEIISLRLAACSAVVFSPLPQDLWVEVEAKPNRRYTSRISPHGQQKDVGSLDFSTNQFHAPTW